MIPKPSGATYQAKDSSQDDTAHCITMCVIHPLNFYSGQFSFEYILHEMDAVFNLTGILKFKGLGGFFFLFRLRTRKRT